MIDEFKQSVNKILNERLTSPFWGSLILSWLIWNWKIVYLTIFISQDKIVGTKIDFIVTNYYNLWYNILLPIFSALFLTTIFPYVTNWLYAVSIKFNKKKTDIKNKVEGASLLTLEKSVQIREEIKNISKKYVDVTKESEEEIKILNAEIIALKEAITSKEFTYNSALEENDQFRSDIAEQRVQIHSLESENNQLRQQTGNIQKLNLEIKRLNDEILTLKGDTFSPALKDKALNMLSNIEYTDIDTCIEDILSNNYILRNDQAIRHLLKYGFAVFSKRHDSLTDRALYDLTPLGHSFREYFYAELMN